MIGIGIDTGGTCTDAVIYDVTSKEILAFAKSDTTHEQLEIGMKHSLQKLPMPLIRRASYISLSTTLATNACVENKGGRVFLILIGVSEKVVRESYHKYGFDSMDDMLFLDADPNHNIPPDWQVLEDQLPHILAIYDSIAITQIYAFENNGAYEKEAKERILAHKELPVVCAYALFKDLNAIKRGAGAYLNARLIPVIDRFFDAIHHVLDELDIHLPFLIMRSDGSLVSEEYSKKYPVETLLCGPTASMKGAAALMPQEDAIVIDMGGTTTDVALIKGGYPKTDPKGIRIGGWQTFVKGVYIDTFALGGDSHVCYRDATLFLGNERVLPISFLADQYPSVLPELERLARTEHGSARPLFEHLIWMKDIADRTAQYTEMEQRICAFLQEGPLSLRQLAERLPCDVYHLKTDRLEKEGVLLRSGFTPTDVLVLDGKFVGMSEKQSAKAGAMLAAAFLSKCVGVEDGQILQTVYRLVRKKLYCNLVRILWTDAHDGKKTPIPPADLEAFAEEAFAMGSSETTNGFYRNLFVTSASLIGAGAPTRFFIEDVAALLHTKSHSSPYSGVCNALGALLGDACVYETVWIGVEQSGSVESEQFVVYGDEKLVFTDYEKAVEAARAIAERRATEKLKECGADDMYSLTSTIQKDDVQTKFGTVCLGGEVVACAKGKYSF